MQHVGGEGFTTQGGDFAGGPVVKNPPSNAGVGCGPLGSQLSPLLLPRAKAKRGPLFGQAGPLAHWLHSPGAVPLCILPDMRDRAGVRAYLAPQHCPNLDAVILFF